MPDQIQNPNINFPGQGSPPVIPPAPVVGAPEAGTNPGPAAPQSADWQNAGGQVEPVPLPKATDVETPALTVAPEGLEGKEGQEGQKAAEPHPLFEKPAMVTPGEKEEGRRKKEEGHGLSKTVVAGIAGLVFLVVGGLVGGSYLVRQKQDVTTLAEGEPTLPPTGMLTPDPAPPPPTGMLTPDPAPPPPTGMLTPDPTPTPVVTAAHCESLVGQVSSGTGGWISKTDAEFVAAARPGDRVRFICTGHKTQGNFTKSAFFINDVLHVDDVVKLNDTQFAVEYTIGAAGALKVESVLLHDNKGWVD